MFAKYAPIVVLATAALAAPLDPAACQAGVPIVTVTTYVTGYPPTSTAPSTSADLPAVPSPTPGAFYEVNANPPAYGAHSSPGTTTTEPAKPNSPPTTSTSTSAAPPPPPPPPPATYEPAPKPPTTTTTAPSNPQPSYGTNPPPPPPSNNNPPTYGARPPNGASGVYSMTPHDKFSSSVGVVGCKINTDRVAYWPMDPDVTRYCVKVTHNGRSVHLLHIDKSGGAYDISYDAWNYLATGKSATESPHCGGGINMEYEWVDNHACSDLVMTKDGQLPVLASNPDLAIAAPEPKDQYVQLWNFKDLKCEMGVDEPCKMPDYAAGYNQAECPSGLGMSSAKTGYVFEEVAYVTKADCPAAS